MILRLEFVTVPVTDVDRAKAFYVDQVGFSVEQDVHVDEEHRFIGFFSDPDGISWSVHEPSHPG
jgi:catechol 2,3-dioxygenase-like lactoylglutathione lyase family enzyme